MHERAPPSRVRPARAAGGNVRPASASPPPMRRNARRSWPGEGVGISHPRQRTREGGRHTPSVRRGPGRLQPLLHRDGLFHTTCFQTPAGGEGTMVPGEYLFDGPEVELNAGRPTVTLAVNNTGDR